jgi:hypothetical protein
MNSKVLIWLMFVTLVVSCKERFDPKLQPAQTNFLVVEGFINANGATTIRLSRTTPLEKLAVKKPELGAQVKIKGDNNTEYTVSEKGNGTYTSDLLTLNANVKYQVHIKTKTGGEYLSELTSIKIAPPIDSVSWQPKDNGIQLSVSAHDQPNNSRYYKWEYEETWEIRSAFMSYFEFKNGILTERNPADVPKLYYCWNSTISTSILLGSSAQLSNNVIHLAPLIYIPIDSRKISVRYSILVKQYSLDREAYDFYKMLKGNTESLGSIFDSQPTDLTGNIVSISNPLEKVIGYISAGTMVEKRIFLLAHEVKSKYLQPCLITTVKNHPDSIKASLGGSLQPFSADAFPPAPISEYYASSPVCIDCRLSGTNVKPSFW